VSYFSHVSPVLCFAGIHEVSDSRTSLAFVDHFPSSWFLITLNFHREDIYANYFLVLTAGNA